MSETTSIVAGVAENSALRVALSTRLTPLGRGFDIFKPIAGSTTPKYLATIDSKHIYAGVNTAGALYVAAYTAQHQTTWYQHLRQHYPQYPAIVVVDAANLQVAASLVPYISINVSGSVDIAGIHRLLGEPAARASTEVRDSLINLMSSCAASQTARNQVISLLGITSAPTSLFRMRGVLAAVHCPFTANEMAWTNGVVAALPLPIVDLVHQVAIADLPGLIKGDTTEGGLIRLDPGQTGTGQYPFAGGGQTRPVQNFQLTLVHEIGHEVDAASKERARFTTLHDQSLTDPNAFLSGRVLNNRNEEFAGLWSAYLSDSRGVLEAVQARRNSLLSAKLSHVIDQIPHHDAALTPVYRATDGGDIRMDHYGPVLREAPVSPWNDGKIVSVDGIRFWSLVAAGELAQR